MNRIERTVELSGITPILFDRYAGNNREQLQVMDKIYLEDGKMVFPSINILSFLSAQNTESAPQRVVGRGWKAIAKAAQSYVQINPLLIPFSRNGKAITKDNAELEIHYSVARIMKGKLSVPNPKERPLLKPPWSLRFDLTLLETPDLNENLLIKLFEGGGVAIGLGTFRGVFGKFVVLKWEKRA